LTSTVWCTMTSYRLNRVLLVAYTWRFCRRCAVQPEERRDKWQEQWFLHHDNTPSHTSVVVQRLLAERTFPSSPNHRTLRISLRVTLGCSPLWQWATIRHVPQTLGTTNRMRRQNSGRFQNVPPVVGSMKPLCVWAKGPALKLIGKRCSVSFHYSAIPLFRELYDCPSLFVHLPQDRRKVFQLWKSVLNLWIKIQEIIPVNGWTIHLAHTAFGKSEADGTKLFITQKQDYTEEQRHDARFHIPFIRRLLRGSPHCILYKFFPSLSLSVSVSEF
jgi:hypothetical protein